LEVFVGRMERQIRRYVAGKTADSSLATMGLPSTSPRQREFD
jgi:hypothetical protein